MNYKGATPWNRPQRCDEKNKVICLVVMFTPGVRVIQMTNSSFADDSKKGSHNLGEIFNIPERFY